MTLLTDFVVIVGIIVSVILIILLAKSKNRGLDKNVLILIFCFIFFTSLHTYASLHQLNFIYYISFLFDYNLIWVLGPLLLIYIKSLFLDNIKLLRNNRHHFLPSIFFTVFLFIPKMLAELFYVVDIYYLKFYQENQMVFIIIRNCYFLLYLIFSIKLFFRLKTTLNKQLNFSINEYNWITKLVLGSSVFVSLDTVVRSYELFVNNLQFDGGYITLFAIVVFITYLGYNGLNESRILIPAFLLEKTSYTEITFTNEETILLEQKIKHILENEKLFLDETLSLKRLSVSLNISDKKLSSFLNNHLNTKFKDYINFYRVAEVKEKLKSQEYAKYTLFAIANECGFNSKASFYRVFKKHTGVSPSQYIKTFND